jgi:hypothetical protein
MGVSTMWKQGARPVVPLALPMTPTAESRLFRSGTLTDFLRRCHTRVHGGSASVVALFGAASGAAAQLPVLGNSVTHVDLGALGGVADLGDDFFASGYGGGAACVTFGSMPGLAAVGDNFFAAGNGNLRAVDLSAVSTLLTIGKNFCRGTRQLFGVALPPALREVGRGFLSMAAALVALDLTACRALTAVGDDFCGGCVLLRFLALPPALIAVGEGALAGCAALQEVRLPPSVERVGARFAWRAGSLRSVVFESDADAGYARVTAIGRGFLGHTPRLAHVSLRRATALTAVGAEFLYSDDDRGGVAATVDVSGGGERAAAAFSATAIELRKYPRVTLVQS